MLYSYKLIPDHENSGIIAYGKTTKSRQNFFYNSNMYINTCTTTTTQRSIDLGGGLGVVD